MIMITETVLSCRILASSRRRWYASRSYTWTGYRLISISTLSCRGLRIDKGFNSTKPCNQLCYRDLYTYPAILRSISMEYALLLDDASEDDTKYPGTRQDSPAYHECPMTLIVPHALEARPPRAPRLLPLRAVEYLSVLLGDTDCRC